MREPRDDRPASPPRISRREQIALARSRERAVKRRRQLLVAAAAIVAVVAIIVMLAVIQQRAGYYGPHRSQP